MTSHKQTMIAKGKDMLADAQVKHNSHAAGSTFERETMLGRVTRAPSGGPCMHVGSIKEKFETSALIHKSSSSKSSV